MAAAYSGESSNHRFEGPRLQRLAWKLATVAVGIALVLAALVVSLPSILSTKTGLRSALKVANHFIPGTLAVKEV